MPTFTTNYDLAKPLVNNATDQDLWGGYLNDDIDDIDGLLRQGITTETQVLQTSGFTATASINVKYLYPCDATSGALIATLPTAAEAGNGATVFFKKTDSSINAVTVTSIDPIDGQTTQSITDQYGIIGAVSDGVSRWNTICKINDATTAVKGIVELATTAETLLGLDAVRAITPAGFAGNITNSFSAGLGQASYGLPGGYIIKFGALNDPSSPTGTVTFTNAFPNNIFIVVVSRRVTNGTQWANTTTKSTSSFIWQATTTGAGGIDWIAIGN